MARRLVHHRLPKWETCTILRHPDDDDGSVRALTDYIDDRNMTYHPMRLPGNPQTGDSVEIAWGYFGNQKQHRVRVAGREYVAIADGPVWRALDTGEIIDMDRRSGGDGG